MLNKLKNRQAKLDRVVDRGAKAIFKKLLVRFGVGGLSASIATRFVFKYIFKPMARHFVSHGILRSFSYNDGPYHYVVHKKGVEIAKRSSKNKVSL